SPDGLLMATASGDKTARIWRVAEGTSLFVLGGAQGHKDYLTGVAFSPDGQTVATSSADGTVRLWNVADGKMRLTLTGPAGVVRNVAFSPDGTIVAAGAEDYKVYSWSAADGAPIRTVEGFEAPPGSIAFTPDGQFLAIAASWGGRIHLGRVKDGALLHTLEGHDGSITALAFTPDGAMLISGSSDDSVLVWGVPQAGQAPTPNPIESAIGGSGEINGVKVTLNNLRYSEEGETNSDGETYELGEGYQFLIAEVTLENTGAEPRPVYVPGEFKVLDEYRNSRDMSVHGILNESLTDNAGDTLAPGAKVTGEISFEIEKDVKGLTLVYGPMSAPGEIVFKLDR
ncbi:MAG TPA: DUF4352 domain-containing protein, partial [Chloroflexia bacterium]|nr:DUF4352 domain-containing protein [Chloroflexia bacterium]